jgi:acyl-[acyl-carrier-protein]-phospholipid O-acyltransferase/long-chain-fatty-acid--[acyl-carrier-protein] ligase
MSDETEAEVVSTRAWWSLGAILVVQSQNAFNDNFVKFILMGLAMAVAAGTPVGENIEFLLAAMIPLPFILLAPVSGYLSDRYSKSRVIWHCLVLQLTLFIFIGVSIVLRSVEAAVFGFFLLAVQSTLFSPAKQGILKEIVGSRRLGLANGLMSMLTMVGILGGMWLAGRWFDSLLEHYNELHGVVPENGWRAALFPVVGAGAACVVALLVSKLVVPTPAHPSERFSKGVWLRHFRHLRQLFAEPVLRSAALFITCYWLVANFLGINFVQFAKEIYPDASQAGRMTATATMLFWVGGGLVLGSSLVSVLSRHRIRLGLSPLGALGMGIGLTGAGLLTPASLWWNLSLGFVGFASGFFVVPLNAWLQDSARDDHRARVISALNLMTSLSGVIAILVGFLLKKAGLGAGGQVLCFVPALAFVAFFLVRRIARLRPAEA